MKHAHHLVTAPTWATPARLHQQVGFTLIELIMVMVIVGVMAVFIAPRLTTSDFESRGFYDETLSLLRFAQKTAVAQRRTVCVTLSGTGVTLLMASAPPPSTTCDTAPRLPSTPKNGTGLTATPNAFQFTPVGSTDQAADMVISIPGNPNITVARQTGYVY